ncbi:uncharacterized protein FA14DRAFT_63384 [Meira miltonrushii]|uniref:SAP domain-containing protein n=1 Tax=Meira miltonrushii TaxID=1280837 RepID=A0A316V954_9BASI|nr:uncharacterized protein FA14DRAFT_63384 [Meira miltonrushii]PWN33568.1 hypothetical protein FA14DRAFT_63384 [Meira miltonrushii]
MLRSIASNPGLRASMLRSSKSNPALRAASASVIPPVHTMPSRSLVSTVLLTKDAYESKKVTDLKTELRQRGLSTTGKRTDLIKRLIENDSNRAKVLPISSKDQSTSISAPSTPRKTLRTRSATSSAKVQQGAPETSAGAVGSDATGATIPHPPNMEPGQISSNASEATPDGLKQPDMLEALSTAPGVPPEKAPQAPITFEVKIPYESTPVDPGPEVPLITAYFHPEDKHFDGIYRSQDGPIAHMPKVMTVSGEETYPGGGVSHHQPIFEDADVAGYPRSSEPVENEGQSFSSALSSLWSSMQKDMGVSSEKAPKIAKQAKEIRESTANTTRTLLQDARETFNKATRGNGSSSASYSTSSTSYSGGNTRPLNAEEQSGLYVLGGIVLGGFVLGGLGSQSKRKSEKVKAKIEESVHEIRSKSNTLDETELHDLVQRAESALRS